MTISNSERLNKVHEDAIREFDQIQVSMRAERLQCLQDRRFYSITGAQWEGPLSEQFENKPRFEFNRVHLAVIRIINEYRNNRITVDFQPKDGSKDDELADTCDGLYRADEQSCTANEAYDNAFEEGVGGGFGACRLRAVYEDEYDDENECQRIRMEPIFDADSCVFFNLDAQRQDKADAKRAYVLTPYTLAAYMEEWEDDPGSWPKMITQSEFDWCTPDIVWVCELYKIEEKSEVVRYFRSLVEGEEDMRVTQAQVDNDEKLLEQLAATGFRLVREKRVKRRKVHKYILSGGKVLEDCGYVPGTEIPVIPFYAKRWVVDGVERCMGHVRLAKDAQRLSNMLMSWLAEIASRFDIEKPIVTPEQMQGWATMWAQDNVKKFPYLFLNAQTDAEGNVIPGSATPQAYTKSPQIPPAMAALMQMAEQALQDLLGNQQAGEQLQPNLSGKAVELIQNRLDMQVFIYMSNFAKFMKRCGEVWLSMMKDIVVEKSRPMKTVDKQGDSSQVIMNQPAYDKDEAKEIMANDLTRANMEVTTDVGPSSSSRRAATVRALTGMLQLTQDPEIQQVLSAMAMLNMEGEGISEVRDYFRAKLVRMGAVKPTEEEVAEMEAEKQQSAQQPPDAQTQFLLSSAEEASAAAAEKRAQTVETLASANLKNAQADKTVAETVGTHQNTQIAGVEALRGIVQPDLGQPPA